jgi:hypothetical protein
VKIGANPYTMGLLSHDAVFLGIIDLYKKKEYNKTKRCEFSN